MKTRSFVPALVALAACNTNGFGPSFEGEVTMTTTRAGVPPMTTTMTIKAKGDKVRLEMPSPMGGTMSALYEPKENKLVLLMDAQKTAMDMNLGAPGAPQPNTDGRTSAIDRTGKRETIAGIGCEDWIVKDPGGSRTEVCVAEGLPFIDLDALRHVATSSWKADLRAKKTFPLRSVEYDKDGKELSRAEVTSVKREKLSDSLFEVPEGYARMPRAPSGGHGGPM